MWTRTVSMLGLLLLGIAFEGSAVRALETGFLDRTVTVNGVIYRYQVYVPVDYTPQKTYPVLLFLHGAGERGDDGLRQTQVGLGAAIRHARDRFPFLVVFPQAHRETRWVGEMAAQALQALEQTVTEFHGDPHRLYLSGISLGGYGTWSVAAQAVGRFAALVPVCGWVTLPRADLPAEWKAAFLADNPFAHAPNPYTAVASQIGQTPVWLFHGAADPLVSVDESRRMVVALQARGTEVKYTEYAGVGHEAWDQAYADPELIPWLLSHQLTPR
jgi:predicted peptidase